MSWRVVRLKTKVFHELIMTVMSLQITDKALEVKVLPFCAVVALYLVYYMVFILG